MVPGAEEAYGGTPPQIPGSIEAEEYDLGGDGVGYSDVDAGNIGGVSYFNPTSLWRVCLCPVNTRRSVGSTALQMLNGVYERSCTLALPRVGDTRTMWPARTLLSVTGIPTERGCGCRQYKRRILRGLDEDR